MPQVVATQWVPVAPEVAFAVSQTTGETRLRWDRFIRSQHLIGSTHPGKDVETATRSRLGPRMTSRYVSYRPPRTVGMTMVRGPWFFATFGGGWRFQPESRGGVDGTLATWKYTFTTRPSWLRRVADPIGVWLLGREIRSRIVGWGRGCEDPVVLDALDLGGAGERT